MKIFLVPKQCSGILSTWWNIVWLAGIPPLNSTIGHQTTLDLVLVGTQEEAAVPGRNSGTQ